MRKSPPAWLMLLVVGAPGALTLVMLWPQIQDNIIEFTKTDNSRPVQLDDPDSSVEDEFTVTKADVNHSAPASPTMLPVGEPSAVEKTVAKNREELQTAKTSYERVVKNTDAELLQTFGLEQWREIQTFVAQAQQLPQPIIATEKYANAEAMLRELRADLPNRQLIAELADLKSQHDPLSFLTKLSEVTRSRPALHDRPEVFWTDVASWAPSQWLAVVRRESEDLSPDDGGFADVYLALADFHRKSGTEHLALKAEQVAWDHALRMTNPTRSAQSAIQSLQRLPDSAPSSVRTSRLEAAKSLARDVADTHDRMEILSRLATLSPATQQQNFLDEIENLAVSSRIDLRLYWPAIYRCRVLAETRPPTAIFDLCVSIPKYNGRIGFDPFAANTMTYSYAGHAAARIDQRPAFWKAVLLAEAQQLDSTGVEMRDQRACAVLATADLRQRNFRRVVHSAMNLREHTLRPALLFPVMNDSPQDVPIAVATPLIQRFGTVDSGCVAVASYMPTFVSSFESEPDAISWILGLNTRSVRMAALTGFARHCVRPKTVIPRERLPPPPVDMTDPRGLLENAEAETALLQRPLNRAWAYLWIAACWNRLDRPASYANALQEFDDALHDAWQSYWRNARDNNRTSSYRRNKQQEHDLNQLIECYCMAAELQAFVLEDPHRAIENVINAARASQPLNHGNGSLKMRLWLISEAIHRECDIPPGVLDSVFLPPNNYFQMLLASRRNDLGSLKQAVEKIETEGIGKGYEAPDYLARAYAELAIIAARNGDLATYRSARRKAAGIVASKGSNESIFLPLCEADACAGELALAMNRKRGLKPLQLYGTSGRTDSVVCTQLSLASRTPDALKRLPSATEPFFRLQAMHAVAACRSQTTPHGQLDHWLAEQNEQLDRIAILCGLACEKPIP